MVFPIRPSTTLQYPTLWEPPKNYVSHFFRYQIVLGSLLTCHTALTILMLFSACPNAARINFLVIFAGWFATKSRMPARYNFLACIATIAALESVFNYVSRCGSPLFGYGHVLRSIVSQRLEVPATKEKLVDMAMAKLSITHSDALMLMLTINKADDTSLSKLLDVLPEMLPPRTLYDLGRIDRERLATLGTAFLALGESIVSLYCYARLKAAVDGAAFSGIGERQPLIVETEEYLASTPPPEGPLHYPPLALRAALERTTGEVAPLAVAAAAEQLRDRTPSIVEEGGAAIVSSFSSNGYRLGDVQ